MTAGSLVAFYGYTLQLFVPLYGVVEIYSKLQRAGASVRRLMEISEAQPVMRDRPDALALQPEDSGAIELKDVVSEMFCTLRLLRKRGDFFYLLLGILSKAVFP